jgi:hypothetical protein
VLEAHFVTALDPEQTIGGPEATVAHLKVQSPEEEGKRKAQPLLGLDDCGLRGWSVAGHGLAIGIDARFCLASKAHDEIVVAA